MSQENQSMSREGNIRKANFLAIMLGGIVSGSIVVNQVTANDIDVFIPSSNQSVLAGCIEKYNLLPYDPLAGTEEYEQASALGEIVGLYRGDYEINLIVVDTRYWPAYLGAHRKLCERPDLYVNKAKRHNLFISHKNVIREWLGQKVRELKPED